MVIRQKMDKLHCKRDLPDHRRQEVLRSVRVRALLRELALGYYLILLIGSFCIVMLLGVMFFI